MQAVVHINDRLVVRYVDYLGKVKDVLFAYLTPEGTVEFRRKGEDLVIPIGSLETDKYGGKYLNIPI